MNFVSLQIFFLVGLIYISDSDGPKFCYMFKTCSESCVFLELLIKYTGKKRKKKTEPV